MKKAVFFLCAVAVMGLLISPAWAEDSNLDEFQALKQQLMELNKMVQGQQKQLQQQDMKIQQQERELLDLQEAVVEPTPYSNVDEVVERVKAEMPPPGDGFTLGGGKIQVTPYGFLRLDMAYDQAAIAAGTGNTHILVLPDVANFDDDEAFRTTATATRLGFKFDGPEFAGGNVRGKLEFDFDEVGGVDNGGDVTAHRIRMRHAYGELVYPTWSLLAGQTWDVIGPNIPYMLDCMVMWGSGNVGYRRAQLRLTKWCELDNAKVTTQLSLNHHDRKAVINKNFLTVATDGDFDEDGTLDGADSGWPLLEGRIAVSSAIGERKFTLGIAGAYGEEEANFTGTGDMEEDADIWLVILDAKAVIIPGLLSLNGELYTGENIDAFMGGIFQGFGVSGDDINEVEASGGFIHAMLTPRPDLKINAGYGADIVDRDDLGGGNTGARTANRVVFGNVIYTVTPNFDIGLEVGWHKTDWLSAAGDDNDNVRIQGAAIYKF